MTAHLQFSDRRAQDRRQRAASFHFPERRTGFDRRDLQREGAGAVYHRLLDGYRRMPIAVAGVIALIAALNIADLWLTMRALDLGATEANPLMAGFLGADPAAAAVFKVGVGAAVASAMWFTRRYRRVLELSLVLLAGFALLTAYHLAGLAYLSG